MPRSLKVYHVKRLVKNLLANKILVKKVKYPVATSHGLPTKRKKVRRL
jgi:hypothetical protein